MIERRFFKLNKIDEATRDKIVEIIKVHLSDRKDVAFAYLHGSFVEGGSFRDIDVAIYTTEFVDELAIESDLSYELTEKAEYPVEVRVINKAPVAFQMAVLRKGRLILSGSEETRTDFIEDAGRRYREYAHFRNIMAGA
jgi:predicted nucleotidyltransferase